MILPRKKNLSRLESRRARRVVFFRLRQEGNLLTQNPSGGFIPDLLNMVNIQGCWSGTIYGAKLHSTPYDLRPYLTTPCAS
jgi:hypothetical protein